MTKRVSLALIALAAATVVHAGTVRHDVDLQQYVDYGDGIRLIGGVTVSNPVPTSFGSGTVIAPEWVLTAAHVVYDVITPGTTISFETDPDPDEVVAPGDFPLSGFFYVDQVAIHEFYDNVLGPAGGFDVALLHLEVPVQQYTPYERFRGTDVGQLGTAVGFGASGTGITGYDPMTGGFFRLAGDNMIDGLASDPRMIEQFYARTVTDPDTGQTLHFTREQIASQFIISDFDDPATDGVWTNDGLNPLGSPDPLALEYEVAPGDSGGPLLTLVGGQYQVVGINSFVHALPAPYGDGTDDASYSDLAGYLRVSQFNGWIDEVTGVPEPGTATLLGVGAALALCRRRRND